MPEITTYVPGIIKLLCNLNPSKASGTDSIKPIVLKNLSNEITLFLSVPFQKSLDSSQVPHDWTKACVTPSWKRGIKMIPLKALTTAPYHWNALCKVMEHIVASNLSRHFKQNDIPLWPLNGFCERRSFKTQLIQLVEELARNTSQGGQTDLILLDFSKVFNRANHLKLLHKLHQHGARGNTVLDKGLSWLGALKQLYWRVKAHQKSLSTLESPKVLCLDRYCFYYILMIYMRTYIHRSDFLQMTRQSISLSITLTRLDILQTWERLWDMDFKPSKCQVLHIFTSRHATWTGTWSHGPHQVPTCKQRPEVEYSLEQNFSKCKQNTRFLEKEHQD